MAPRTTQYGWYTARDGVPKVGCDVRQAPPTFAFRCRDDDIELAVVHPFQNGTGVELSEALLVHQRYRLVRPGRGRTTRAAGRWKRCDGLAGPAPAS